MSKPSHAAPPRLLQSLQALLFVLSGLMVLLFILTAFSRLRYPFEYDWIEDGILASVRQLLAGQPLYAAPTVHFIPYLYTPLYLYVAAGCAKIAGIGYAPLRLLSIVCTLGSIVLIYAFVLRETEKRLPAAIAAGCFASFYPVVNACFDIGRVDMVCLCFTLAALYATRCQRMLLAAVLWLAAFQTKQSILPFAIVMLCTAWPDRRRLLTGLGTFSALLAASIAWLTYTTHGWYRFYVFSLGSGLGLAVHSAKRFIPIDLILMCAPALLIIVSAAWLVRKQPGDVFFYAGSLAMVLSTWYYRAHTGANVNVLVPLYAWIALLFGIAFARLMCAMQERFTPLASAAVLMLALLQLAMHARTPTHFVPTQQETAQRFAFEEQLKNIPGAVLVLSHPEYAVLAGKPLYAGSESVGAVMEAANTAPADALKQQYVSLLRSSELQAIVLDRSADAYPWLPSDFVQHYTLHATAAGGDGNRFTSQPRWIYQRNP